MVSSAHNVCPKGYYIAIVSTIAERESNNHLELQPGLERLGKIEEQFMGPPIPLYEPIDDGTKDNVFISKSYDATSHFESTTGMFLLLSSFLFKLKMVSRSARKIAFSFKTVSVCLYVYIFTSELTTYSVFTLLTEIGRAHV